MTQKERIELAESFIYWLSANKYDFKVSYLEGTLNHIVISYYVTTKYSEKNSILKELYFYVNAIQVDKSDFNFIINYKGEDHLFVKLNTLRELEMFITGILKN